MMASVIPLAFVSSVSIAVIAFAATLPTPFSYSHLVTSSIAAAKACWLCRSRASASTVAMFASELFGMAIVLDWWCGNPSSSCRWLGEQRTILPHGRPAYRDTMAMHYPWHHMKIKKFDGYVHRGWQ